VPRPDSVWLVPVELDNVRISNRISASRSGGSADALINVIDAAESKFCLLLNFFSGRGADRDFAYDIALVRPRSIFQHY
jgi:hypothetical protein